MRQLPLSRTTTTSLGSCLLGWVTVRLHDRLRATPRVWGPSVAERTRQGSSDSRPGASKPVLTAPHMGSMLATGNWVQETGPLGVMGSWLRKRGRRSLARHTWFSNTGPRPDQPGVTLLAESPSDRCRVTPG